jgi:hypothetical protein
MSDHYPTAPVTPSWPFSGRGEKRPQTARARRTNFPLEPPAALRSKGQNSSEYRRWKDLCRHYGQRLGPQRLADEAVRAKLLSLIWTTLELERARDAGTVAAHTLLHLSQHQLVLLAELGLNDATRSNGDGGALRDYLRDNNGAGP